MIELERLAAAQIYDPEPFMAEVHWLRVYLSLEGPPPVPDRAAAQADAEALRRVVAIVGPGSVADELARRLEELEAALAVRPPSQRTTSELKEFVVFRLCDALAEAKRVPVALLQTGVTPDGVPPTLDTLLVHTALKELGLAEGPHNVRKRVARAIAADGPTLWRRQKTGPILEV